MKTTICFKELHNISTDFSFNILFESVWMSWNPFHKLKKINSIWAFKIHNEIVAPLEIPGFWNFFFQSNFQNIQVMSIKILLQDLLYSVDRDNSAQKDCKEVESSQMIVFQNCPE